jgi:hypothetical protein
MVQTFKESHEKDVERLDADCRDFEKHMRLAYESDKAAVRVSPSQAQVDQMEGWLLEKPISYTSRMTTSARKVSLTIGTTT